MSNANTATFPRIDGYKVSGCGALNPRLRILTLALLPIHDLYSQLDRELLLPFAFVKRSHRD